MEYDLIVVLLVVLMSIILFATELVRIDVAALIVAVTLMITGVVTPEQGVSGFSNPATITVFSMLMISLGLENTGLVSVLGEKLMKFSGKKEWQVVLLLMVVVGVLSAFINNTAAVAVFLPVVLRISKETGISPSKLLMPTSFAAIIGGSCTLIGTSTNILVSSIAESHGYGGFSMFEFSKLGAMFLGAGIIYMVFIGRFLIPERRGKSSLTDAYQLREYLTEIIIKKKSKLIGKTLGESQLREKFDIDVLEIMRMDGVMVFPDIGELIKEGDLLLIRGNVKEILKIQDQEGIDIKAKSLVDDAQLSAGESVLVEAVIAPESFLIGKTVKTASFRQRYGAMTVAVRRDGVSLRKKISLVEFRLGDSLLIECQKSQLQSMYRTTDLIMLNKVTKRRIDKSKMGVGIAIIVSVVTIASLGILPVMVCAFTGGLLMVLTKCISLRRVYRRMEWQIIFLLAGIIPLGVAMENSGAATYIANMVVNVAGDLGPVWIVALLYLVTVLTTEIMSNNASAILLAPIAMTISTQLGYDPKPFLLTIMFAASFSFLTPIGYQTNTLIYGPGNYKYSDYARTGVILSLLMWGMATFFISFFWM
ncbi:MAG: di/tricarboxylate transporter [Sphingobacteriales bacterium]|jgi:di/tricarboxylate transporter